MRLAARLTMAAVLCLACAGSGAVDKYVDEARRLQESGDPARAVEVMEKAVKEHPNSARAHAHLGLYLGMKAGRTANFMEAGQLVRTAFEHLDRAVALDSMDRDARYFRGILSVQVPDFFGKLETGVADLEFALKRQDQADTARLATTWSMLGQGYQKQNKLGPARTAWQKVVELAKDTAVIAQARAKVVAIEAQGVPASSEPDELPDDPAALRELGRKHLEAKEYALAADALRKAARLDSTNLEGLRLLIRAIDNLAQAGYDERIGLNTDLRTNLAFEYYRVLDRAVGLAPHDMELRLSRGAAGVYMPFFVGKLDQGIADLEAVAAADTNDETRAEALYLLGVGYRRKGSSYWAKVASEYAKTEAAGRVLESMRPRVEQFDPAAHSRPVVAVSFVLGFQDELAPQTAVWVEDDAGTYVATLYVSGFSGHAKAAQVNLLEWSRSSQYRGCDAVTGASIDLGQHVCTWDLKDYEGRMVKPGPYTVRVEASWWPSMKHEAASVRLATGGSETSARAEPGRLIPLLDARYLP